MSSRIRVRIDGVIDGNPVHVITNLNGLLSFVGYPMQKRLYRAFEQCKSNKYSKRLRRGVRIEIFEY